MIATLMEAALRSLVAALAVWAGLRVFGIRNVPAQKAAWGLVLAGAFFMPLMLPMAARLPWLPAATVVLPAHPFGVAISSRTPDTAPASIAPAREMSKAPMPARESDVAPAGFTAPDRFPAPVISSSLVDTPADTAQPPTQVARKRSFTIASAVWLAYFAIAAALLLRIGFGLVAAFRLWRAAEPVSVDDLIPAGELHMRSSHAVSSPVTIGSAVVLPSDYATWGSEKLRIVLAHERSHVRQGDFYLQLLAGLYAALFWFSPLGWWLKSKLSDLAEAISDRAGLSEAASRASYAQVLLEFAAMPRPTLIGVAMARSNRISGRIERLLNESTFRQAFAGTRRRALLGALIVPVTLFAATALVRVEAAGQEAQPTTPAVQPAPSTGTAHPDQAQSAVASQAAPDAGQAEPASTHVDVPAIHFNVPAIHVNVPAQHIEVPAVHVNVPATHIDVPAQHVNVPAIHLDVPGQHIDIPARHIDVPAQKIDVPAIHIDVPSGAKNSDGHASIGSTGELYAMLTGPGPIGPGPIFAQRADPATSEATFDRTLTFSGRLDLNVATGSGNIHLTRGSAGQIRIHARVYSQEASDAAEVRSIAANPPIQQDGSAIRIGGGPHRQGTNHISIDYEIEAPADALLSAASGSGDITDNGVGQNAKLITGSGDINATGLQGGFTINTGSGNIDAQDTGEGKGKAQTGSGDIEIKGAHGGVYAMTGSGDIKASGTPASAWTLRTGSGNVEFWPGNAPLTLDASAGSGTISTAQAMMMQGELNRHHITENLNGGGPVVRLETGSGDIRVR